MKNCAFTIVAKNYIGLARILEKSFKDNNPETDFFVFVVDEFDDMTNATNLPDNLIFARSILEIPDDKWIDMSFKYDLTEFCTSIKPTCFMHLLKRTEYEKIIYLDPDIYVYNSFDVIFKMLDEQSIVITPHFSIIQDIHLGETPERDLMGNGVFNLGFCAIKRSEIAKRMLTWWSERLFDKCYIDSYETYFTDQKWMDFLPCFFNSDELLVTRHLGMNIAPWNFFERKIFLKNEKLFVTSRNRETDTEKVVLPVLFVHYSGYNYNELKKGNVIQNNIASLKKYEDVELLTNFYARAIQENSFIFDEFIKEKYKYGVFDNGVTIKKIHRRLYRALKNKGQVVHTPFSSEERSFYSSLQKLGMTKETPINIERTTKFTLQGFESKLMLFNRLMRLIYRLLGFERYLLLIRVFKPFSRYESQIHLLSKDYDKENIIF
ncbi:hypothetical protein [Pedobacter nutrimenti]|uniref:Glycosyl transferase family 8 n=1 Tax=Pedobacter nutrimenti TaxID=1241337 RepID=A0A318UJY6_9SPHI|nr:hypothetical protein [Pedobacter nutrimenti]PYF75458.1 hypothetical protein B0O44_1027 [Pedobacter nutrimenti]